MPNDSRLDRGEKARHPFSSPYLRNTGGELRKISSWIRCHGNDAYASPAPSQGTGVGLKQKSPGVDCNRNVLPFSEFKLKFLFETGTT
jgi:hypothetical protein